MEISGDNVYVNTTFKPENQVNTGGTSTEVIYEQEDVYGNDQIYEHGDVYKATVIPSTGQGDVSEKSLYKAAVCLGLLCVLLLAGVTALGVFYANNNKERIMATVERDQLQTSNTNLTRKIDDLNRRLCEVTSCSAAWLKFGCSCYYVSTQKKNWTDSRQDCRERGADLVIIKSLEEQVFLNNLTMTMWIGLSDTVREGTWIWVDGTPLTTPEYWKPGRPDNNASGNVDEECVEIFHTFQSAAPSLTWNDIGCDIINYWVCCRGI